MKKYFSHYLFILIRILKYGLILTIGLFFIAIILLSNVYKNIGNIYKISLTGKDQLTTSISQLQNKSWSLALDNAEAANASFNLALREIEILRTNVVLKKINLFRSQVNDLEYLLKTTEIISRSLARTVFLVKELNDVNTGNSGNSFQELQTEDKIKLLKLIHEYGPELNGLKANLNIALLNANKIRKVGILWPIYEQISDYKLQLQETINLIDGLEPLSRLLLALGGYPQESNILFLLQNNDELRPTGGFIGSFALAKIINGEIVSLTTQDSYHLDMPAVGKWHMDPPQPIKEYLKVDNWYLRDANWEPSWPRAAKKIQEIYIGESQAVNIDYPNFSSIIGINPDFITDILTIVGPINIDNETYTPENFHKLLQYNVEVAYKDKDISSWDRKNIMNELLAELKNRLFHLSLKDWPRLIKTIENNIAEKNIQIYFTNPDWQSVSDNLKASGEVKKTDKDYLMVVDANLAAFKSDAVIKKSIVYNLYQNDHETNASLALQYKHKGGFDWRTTRYRSYTRVYLPLGSKFISLTGLKPATADWLVYDDIDLGKTIFAFFFTVEPGTNKEIIINYVLPARVNEQIRDNNYNLLVQKQSGRRTNELKINFFPNKGAVKKLITDLETDRFFKF